MEQKHKCKFCGKPSLYRIWVGYHGYEYYCSECAEKQTMEDE